MNHMKPTAPLLALMLTAIVSSLAMGAIEKSPHEYNRVSRYSQVRLDVYGPVVQGETLWDIAQSIYSNTIPLNPVMIILFNMNPRAFERNNINCLKIGELLMFPVSVELTHLSPLEAKNKVIEHHQQWQIMQRRCDR
jgi:pilus assembly protein FimV